MTIALFLTFLGLDLSKGYLLAQALLRPYFPSLPHLSRFLRVLQNAQSLLAHLALRLAQGPSLLHVVDLKPLPMAHGHRIRGYTLPGSGVGVGPLGGFAGYALLGVIHDRGLFHRWALLPGNARETWARELLEGLEHVLGDRGFRWVEGVVTPPYRTRGGKVVGTPWRAWMGRVRNWIETRFSVMVRSLGLHRMEARSYWGLVARVNLILLAHNLVRSRVLLKMAGVGLRGSKPRCSLLFRSGLLTRSLVPQDRILDENLSFHVDARPEVPLPKDTALAENSGKGRGVLTTTLVSGVIQVLRKPCLGA